jgi:hypothetical protein
MRKQPLRLPSGAVIDLSTIDPTQFDSPLEWHIMFQLWFAGNIIHPSQFPAS